jgi:hypothetical protein
MVTDFNTVTLSDKLGWELVIYMQQQDRGESQITNHVVSSEFTQTSHKSVKVVVLQWVITKGWNPKYWGSWTLWLYCSCIYPPYHNVVVTRRNIFSAAACTHPATSCLSTRRITSNEPGTRMIAWSAVTCNSGGSLRCFFVWEISTGCTWNISN